MTPATKDKLRNLAIKATDVCNDLRAAAAVARSGEIGARASTIARSGGVGENEDLFEIEAIAAAMRDMAMAIRLKSCLKDTSG